MSSRPAATNSSALASPHGVPYVFSRLELRSPSTRSSSPYGQYLMDAAKSSMVEASLGVI